MPLTAIRHVRKMRGGSQSHLLEADDGNWYVVKFRNNPQHRRILVNEILSAAFLDYLKIASPPTALIQVSAEFLAANPEARIQIGPRETGIEPGWHFGSRYPGDPARTAVYDFLPEELLRQVVNVEDFRGVLVFDQWVGNADGRQSVFYRAMVRRDATGPKPGFVTRMIDQGFAFHGPSWEFHESPRNGVYGRVSVYDSVRSLDDFQPWLDQVRSFPEEVVDRAWKSVPPEWIAEDEEALERLLERLMERRQRLPELIASCRNARPAPFRNWLGM